MARVFSAIDVESEKLKDELERVRDRLDLGFKPVSKHRMHLTLQFFRDIDEEEVEELKSQLDGIDREPFSSQVKGVGAFPSRDHIRVVWAGFREESEIRDLYRDVSDHRVAADNKHGFKPHITLMRVKDIGGEEKRKLQRTIRDFGDHVFGDMRFDEIKLYRSDLEEGGSRYSKLYSRKL